MRKGSVICVAMVDVTGKPKIYREATATEKLGSNQKP
jgi:hypothetical protein